MSTIVAFAGGLLRHLSRFLQEPPPSLPRATPALANIPLDVLHIIFLLLHNTDSRYHSHRTLWDQEICRGAELIPLSETCRHMRNEAMQWIFREVYNWSRGDRTVWPESLWPFFVEVHLRDRSVRHPQTIPISSNLLDALGMMPSLTKLTLRMDSPLHPDLLQAISLVPHLTSLEIHQARLDGPPLSPNLPFPSLERLMICVSGFDGIGNEGVPSRRGVDYKAEFANIIALLRAVSINLTVLQVSGDLLCPSLLSLQWPHLSRFVVTEHTATPFIPIPDMIAQMPSLRELAILFSADTNRNEEELQPPFTLGVHTGRPLSPLLTSVTLSNMEPADPIFKQLPTSLDGLHIMAARDAHLPFQQPRTGYRQAPLTSTTLPILLQNIARLENLTALSLTLDEPPSSDIIHSIASGFPRLQFLELGHHWFPPTEDDVCNDALIEPLQRFVFLTELRICLPFETDETQIQQHQDAAAWLMRALPHLRTISFLASHETTWCYTGLTSTAWWKYDRSVLFIERLPPPPPRPIFPTVWAYSSN
ncbi:hypothetical protein C8J57DRAFT_1396371 [Mycena rebaudengoi]|nr:hypothetical protein C8J57DRAFT_1396371 [Mycena rebaudengoi]